MGNPLALVALGSILAIIWLLFVWGIMYHRFPSKWAAICIVVGSVAAGAIFEFGLQVADALLGTTGIGLGMGVATLKIGHDHIINRS